MILHPSNLLRSWAEYRWQVNLGGMETLTSPAQTQTEPCVSGLLLWMISMLPLSSLSVSIILEKKYGTPAPHCVNSSNSGLSSALWHHKPAIYAGISAVFPGWCSLAGSFANSFNWLWMFHELLLVSVLYPETQPNMRPKSAAPLFASAEGFEECREEMRQIFKAENIPSVLLMCVISNEPKRAAATTDSITIPIKLWY